MTKIAEIMDRQPVIVAPETPVREVIRKMNDRSSGLVFVCQKGRLRGVISEKSIVKAMAASHENLKKLNASAIMSRGGPRISAGVDLVDAAKLMARRQVRWLPVVQNGRFEGVITLDRLAGESLALASLVLDRMQDGASGATLAGVL